MDNLGLKRFIENINSFVNSPTLKCLTISCRSEEEKEMCQMIVLNCFNLKEEVFTQVDQRVIANKANTKFFIFEI